MISCCFTYKEEKRISLSYIDSKGRILVAGVEVGRDFVNEAAQGRSKNSGVCCVYCQSPQKC